MSTVLPAPGGVTRGAEHRPERIGRRRGVVHAIGIGAVPLELRSAVAARLQHSRPRRRQIPAQPVAARRVTAAADEAPDCVVRTAPVHAGAGHVAVVQRVDPFLAPVAKRGIQGTEGQARAVAYAVIRAAGQAPPCPVVHVIAQIDGVIVRAQARDGRRRFDVVDPASVPVVGPAEQQTQLLIRAESSAERRVELAHAASADDRRVAAQPGHHDRRPCARGFRPEVHAAADAIGVHVGLQRLVDFDRLDEIRSQRVQLDLPHAGLRGWHVHAVDRQVAQPRFGAADLDVLPFALVPLERHARQTAQRVGDIRVRQARDDFGGQHLDDVVGRALAVDLLRLSSRPLCGDQNRFALTGDLERGIEAHHSAFFNVHPILERREADEVDPDHVTARRETPDDVVALAARHRSVASRLHGHGRTLEDSTR